METERERTLNVPNWPAVAETLVTGSVDPRQRRTGSELAAHCRRPVPDFAVSRRRATEELGQIRGIGHGCRGQMASCPSYSASSSSNWTASSTALASRPSTDHGAPPRPSSTPCSAGSILWLLLPSHDTPSYFSLYSGSPASPATSASWKASGTRACAALMTAAAVDPWAVARIRGHQHLHQREGYTDDPTGKLVFYESFSLRFHPK